ncbi:MAG: hypothetical protein O7D35_11100 [Acidobacteria bacterium]|nr:hypothetical protein [Acidobacteriota bacterium]
MNRDRRLNLDWVSVRYRSVMMLVLAIAGLAIGGWFVWSHITESNSPTTLALRSIEKAESLYRDAAAYGGGLELAPIRDKAREHLTQSRTLFGEGRFEEARVKAILSRNNSQKVIDIARSGETTRTEARFYKFTGGVQVKRAGSLIWDVADPDLPLRVGDAIKTSSSGAAQIIYFDGSITTIKPGSLVEITTLSTDPGTRRVRVTESLKVGGVRSRTFGSNVEGSFHEVTTKNSTARAMTASPAEFEVDYDATTRATRVAVHAGEASLSSGEKSVVLQAAERIQVAGNGEFGQREAILPAPRQLAPGDHKIFLTEDDHLSKTSLVWSEVPGARGYKLQVSRDSLMSNTIQDRSLRNTTQAVLNDLETGQWFWRVAALDGSGEVGQFSHVSEFRIAGPESDLTRDTTPPLLVVTEFLQAGSLVIINGRTESDANLWVDNLKVDVYEDGTFTAVVRLHKEGRNQLEIIAQDPAGNETVARREAYLDVF